tara:strand:- start:285 stop:428 length:144 start_codon:yes stop_codon:yes gene_type:complete
MKYIAQESLKAGEPIIILKRKWWQFRLRIVSALKQSYKFNKEQHTAK